MAVTAVGNPEEPSLADLMRMFQEYIDQAVAGLAEIQRALDAFAGGQSAARAAEPLPPGLDEQPPMRGFLMDEPD